MGDRPLHALWRWLGAALLLAPAASADVVPDGSVGPGGALPGPDYVIPAGIGRQEGGNLFHSFERFGLRADESATFTEQGAVGPIERVLSRVTGGERSEIDGLLRSTIPDADLYFSNPAGVLFGPSARLDVEGSVYATTADEVRLEDGGIFPADPSRDGDTVLSTAPPEAFGFLDDAPGPIEIEGARLSSQPGEDLTLVGGDVVVHGGGAVTASDGDLAVFSLASAGEIRLAASEDLPGSFESLGEVRIAEESFVATTGRAGTGRLVIRAGELVVEEGAGILSTREAAQGAATAIDVAVSGAVTIDRGFIEAATLGPGPAGDVSLRADRAMLVGGSVRSVNFVQDPSQRVIAAGAGDAGAVLVEAAQELSLRSARLPLPDGTELPVAPSQITSATASAGASGGVSVTTARLEVADGSGIFSTSGGLLDVQGRILSGTGPSGDLVVRAGDVLVSGADPLTRRPSGLSTSTLGEQGGDVIIRAGQLTLQGGEIRANNFAQDLSGRVLGVGPAHAGSVDIQTTSGVSLRAGTVRLADGRELPLASQISAQTASEGNAGDVSIGAEAGSLVVADGSSILVASGVETPAGVVHGSGSAGKLSIVARDGVLVTGFHRVGELIFSSTVSTSTAGGRGGDLEITSPGPLRVEDRGMLSALTIGEGDAGNVIVHVGSVELDTGQVTAANFRDATLERGAGKAGSITIHAGEGVTLVGGSGISAQTANDRSAGDVDIVVDRGSLVVAEGSGVLTASGVQTPAGVVHVSGPAGDLSVFARDGLLVTGFGILSTAVSDADPASTDPPGGALSVSTPGRIRLENLGTIDARTIGTRDAGSITLEAEAVELESGGAISSVTEGSGAGGSVLLRARDVRISGGAPVEVQLATGERAFGVFSGVFVNSQAIGEEAPAGTVTIVADALRVADGAVISGTTLGEGRGASFDIDVGTLELTGGGLISSSTVGPGPGGEVDVTASEALGIEGELDRVRYAGFTNPRVSDRSGITSTSSRFLDTGAAELGDAGSITVSAPSVRVAERGELSTEALEASGGNVTLHASHEVLLDSGTISATVRGGPQTVGGNIEIDPVFVILLDGSRITAQADEGAGGHIRIAAQAFLSSPDSLVSASAGNPELSGTVEVDAPDVDLAGSLAALPESFLDAAAQLRERCAARTSESFGSFTVEGRRGVAASPEAYLPSPVASEVSSAAAPAVDPSLGYAEEVPVDLGCAR